MDCAFVASHLVAYHFGTATDDDKDAVDAHLLACKSCLETYLALKRATDERPRDRPSASVRARLRADVAEAFPRSPRVAIFTRRIPLYQGLFAAALAAAIALVAPSIVRSASHVAPTAHGARDGAPQVDSARSRAESFQIY